MNDIKEKYQEFRNEPFPEGIAGEEIHGIDLVMLDADTAGLLEKFIGYNYKLTRTDFDLLKRLTVELKTVTKELNGQSRRYLATLWNLADRIVRDLTETKRFIENSDSENLHKKWRQHFDRIREILNEWDPLGVADSIDDEYDSINFAAYSALLQNGNTESVKIAIRKYLKEAMEIDETDEKLNEISKKIKNAVQQRI
ncbi:hypothetical protein [Persicobacter psychrovividus]|uniref:Uncharacterized protein n=1 Tax=Persicobacter psychrovividus TaxID=387638 RepID=A0ABM7VK71_9BACT|nr:hypothetical protein PEPS_36590 [Persicobacter psychrovividus]